MIDLVALVSQVPSAYPYSSCYFFCYHFIFSCLLLTILGKSYARHEIIDTTYIYVTRVCKSDVVDGDSDVNMQALDMGKLPYVLHFIYVLPLGCCTSVSARSRVNRA